MDKEEFKNILVKADELLLDDINKTSSNNLKEKLEYARTTLFYIWKVLNEKEEEL
jgi:hypothetical protein